jgi:hypothetical protein
MASMAQYVEECVSRQYLSADASLVVLAFYKSFREHYKADMDAAPSAGNDSFMLVCDNATHYNEFEYVEGKWEFFYRNRKTDELFDCDFVDFESIDKYLQRTET